MAAVAGKSNFLQKFQNKISVVGKDGSHSSVAEPGVKTRVAPDLRDNTDAQRPWKTPAASALGRPRNAEAMGVGYQHQAQHAATRQQPRGSPKTSHVPVRQKHAHFSDDSHGDPSSPPAGRRQAQTSYHQQRPGRGPEGGGGGGSYARGPTKQENSYEKPEDQLAYSKAPRPVEYVPYNERDYKAQYGREYYELGRLGPDIDPDELEEKRQRQERIRAYAEAVRHENKHQISAAPEKRVQPKPPSTRQKAIEFAKKVPKPKSKAAQPADAGSNDTGDSDDDGITLLQQLALRHQRDKDLVSAIRKDLRIS